MKLYHETDAEQEREGNWKEYNDWRLYIIDFKGVCHLQINLLYAAMICKHACYVEWNAILLLTLCLNAKRENQLNKSNMKTEMRRYQDITKRVKGIHDRLYLTGNIHSNIAYLISNKYTIRSSIEMDQRNYI